LTPAQNIAKIKVVVADNGVAPFNPATDGTAFGITADWLEGNATSPRFDNVVVNGDTDSPLSHTYLSNPEPNPADDIPMVVYVTNLAGGTIQPTIGGRQLVATPDAAGQLPANAIGISATLVIPVLTPFTPPIIPPSEPLPVTPPAPPTIEANIETVANPVE